MQLYSKTIGVGPPLIILHGLFGSGMNWNTLSKKLGAFYQVFLIDQRNHGKSPHADEFNYPVMADDLAQFMEDHRIENASILGHSMGAKTALTFALNYPEKVNKLIAVDMGIKAYPIQDEAIQEGILTLNFEQVNSRTDADLALSKYIPDLGTRQFIMQNLQWGVDKKLGWRMNVQAIFNNIDEIGKSIVVKQPYMGETLFVKGAHSNYILSDDFPEILSAFPKAKLAVIANAGHWIHADNPNDFATVIMEFLGEQDTEGQA